MLNVTSLSHCSTQAKILGAMTRTRLDSLENNNYALALIKNKKGNAFLFIEYFRGNHGAGLTGFRFFSKGHDVTAIVLKSLRS